MWLDLARILRESGMEKDESCEKGRGRTPEGAFAAK
jgi:hypothetical protein